MTFFNFIFALIMGVLRVLGCVIFTMVMFMRLDWDVYMRGLEGWDFGEGTVRLRNFSEGAGRQRDFGEGAGGLRYFGEGPES